MKKKQTVRTVRNDARLIIAAPTQNADIGWATGFWAPDPTIFMEIRGRRYLILRDLEVDRAKKIARVDKVYSTSDLESKIRKEAKLQNKKNQNVNWTDLIHYLFQKRKVKTVLVPRDFGMAYADRLRKLKYKLVTKTGPFYEERSFKTPQEVRLVQKVMTATESALGKGIQLIRKSKVRRGVLSFHGKTLTSEMVRDVIHQHLMAHGCVADLNTIVACGSHTEDPHDVGKGPLRANAPIILDVFPRSLDSGYYGDISRTIVKGKPSKKLKKMYEAVYEAVEVAAGMYRPNTLASDIFKAVHQVFQDYGFQTGEINGRRQGFIHGVGHGVGLDIHEDPVVGSVQRRLKPGHLITLEPGLYYHRVGGVRIEDLYFITKTGAKKITKFPDVFEV